jgi:hypothetical protein
MTQDVDKKRRDEEVAMNVSNVLRRCLSGSQEALSFCISIWRVIQTWDDLVDGDETVSADDINDAFRITLVDIPCNPFYRANYTVLTPLLLQSFLNWRVATKMERSGDKHQISLAYGLRSGVLSLFVACAYLVGGDTLAKMVETDIHLLEAQTIDDYMEEHENA